MSNPDECDHEVFTHGIVVGVFAMLKHEAEAACEKATRETGDKHDWHYSGGRVVIKRLMRDRAAEAEYDSWQPAQTPAQPTRSQP